MPLLKAPAFRPNKPGIDGSLRMTEAEFVDWSGQEGVRAEWVDGEVVLMNAVETDHGKLTLFIILLVGGFVAQHDLGEVFTEPVQIRLPRQRRRRSPDLFFVSASRTELIERTQFNGAPDLVVEAISRDSQNRDRREKFNEYQAAGVKEYWIVDPLSRTFDAFFQHSPGLYRPIPEIDGQFSSTVITGLFFRKEWVWQLKYPKPGPLIQQMSRNRKKLLSTRKGRKSDNQS